MESLQVPATFELPALLPGVRPVSISQLPTYIRSCNTLSRQHGRLLIHIWTPEDSRSATISDSPLLRVVIEDVLVAYINLGVRNGMQDEPLAVEFINVFGCREVVGTLPRLGCMLSHNELRSSHIYILTILSFKR